MEFNDEELEYLESICLNDERYCEWIGHYENFASDYDVPHSSVIWLESTMLVMLLGSINLDRRLVFKTWNYGKSNEESFLVKETALRLLRTGDKEVINKNDKVLRWLEQDTEDYIFYKRLRKKRKKGCYQEIIKTYDEERCVELVDEPSQDKIKSTDLVKMEKHLSYFIERCQMNKMEIVVILNMVTYYDTISRGKFEREIEILNYKLNEMQKGEINLSNIKCPFSEEQVRKSGISKEAKIVLAVINYMFNGNFRQRFGFNCSSDDFSVAIYSVLVIEKYWQNTREDFASMMKNLFNIDIKLGTMSRWLQRCGADYRKWEKTNKAQQRKEIAEKFSKMILEVKKQKMEELKY